MFSFQEFILKWHFIVNVIAQKLSKVQDFTMNWKHGCHRTHYSSESKLLAINKLEQKL